MKKVLFSILSLGIMGTSFAQVTTDTVTTGAGYLNQQFYKLADGNETAIGAKSWHLAFRPNVGQFGATIRFNSLTGDLRFLPNADVDESLVDADTTGWATQESLYDLDDNILVGAFNQNSEIEISGDQFDYSWGQYVMASHSVAAKRAFGALIGSDFYIFKFSLQAVEKIYTVTYFKLGDANEVTYTVDMSTSNDKNFVYSNVIDKNTLDVEPKALEWDLFFGQYHTNVGGGMMYPVAGVLNNLKTEVAKVIDADPAGYGYTGNEVFSTKNNAIGYTWKAAGQGGVTIADTVAYFVKATDGAIWKIRFTGFISGGGSDPLAGSYIFDKELISAVGLNDVTSVFTQLYPNPANDNVQLVVDAVENTTIEIYSLSGTKVYTNTINGGLQTLPINTADFMNGMYQVVVTSNGVKTAKKLVVQH